ncbi:hypothetical protein IRT38_00550 (plasmid) [Acinetobacter sp. SK-43]|uniref:hypothetical protein n=1 Tax=Acinetobacter sp. SK-43 TaxID=2785295 RepID=UPI00188C55BF|nr:hypothetical protein [Acinetobacter sp. SK-43]MBF4453904.1 hypothetical protein [Acinetobacter sp. SK-43]
MRYSDEFIDEVVKSYLRTKNKSFVSKKYNINLHTVRYWIERYENDLKIKDYAKELAEKAVVLAYYDEVKSYDLVAKKFDLERNEVKKILEDYRDEIFYLTPKFREIKAEFRRLLPFFTKVYEKNHSLMVLEKVLLIEMYLGRTDDYLLEKYNPSSYLLDKVRKSMKGFDES